MKRLDFHITSQAMILLINIRDTQTLKVKASKLKGDDWWLMNLHCMAYLQRDYSFPPLISNSTLQTVFDTVLNNVATVPLSSRCSDAWLLKFSPLEKVRIHGKSEPRFYRMHFLHPLQVPSRLREQAPPGRIGDKIPWRAPRRRLWNTAPSYGNLSNSHKEMILRRQY